MISFTTATATLFLLLLTGTPALAADGPVTIEVEGVSGAALGNVRAALGLPRGIIQDGNVNLPWLERFVSDIPPAVKTALEPFGYYHADVHAALDTLEEGRYRIDVRVEPGEPVRITTLIVAVHGPGSGEPELKKLEESFPLRKGGILREQEYEDAKGALLAGATTLGYLDAGFAKHVIVVDPGTNTAQIDLEMDTGRQYRFGDVRFEGAHPYPEQFLRRYLAFKTGDVFSYAKLGQTQLNLVNSDRFKQALVVPEKAGSRDGVVPVLVRLERAPSRRLRPGIGYATDIGPRLSVQYRDLDVFDRGRELHADLGLSQRLENISVGYLIPSADNINSSVGVVASAKREDVTTYVTDAASLEANLTRGLGRGRLGKAYVKVIYEKSVVGFVTTYARLVMPGLLLSQRRYDNPVRPRQGHYYSLDVHGTHEAIGSNTRFLQVVAEGDLLVPLSARFSLTTRLKTGVTFQNASFNDLPASLRFFAGGDRSVRGYAYQSLGPRDANGVVIGGRDLLVGSIEIERALFSRWGVAAFYDAGNAFDSFSRIRFAEGAGIGVRYYSVVGAIRLDLARQINVPHPAYRIHVTMGFAF